MKVPIQVMPVFYKDIIKYLKEYLNEKQKPEYWIITCLPDGQTPKWLLSYTKKGDYNEGYKDFKSEIKNNPFEFWYGEYDNEFRTDCWFRTHFCKEFKQNFKFSYLDTISFININGNYTPPQAKEIKKNKKGFVI